MNVKVTEKIEDLPGWLYCALTRKQMSQAIAQRALKPGNKIPLVFAKSRQQLRRFRKPRTILVRVAARAAALAGTHFELAEGGYFADFLSLEYLSCSKLPGRYEKLHRVDGAGGVVLRTKTELEILLLLKREGENLDWVLPKGRRERGETRRQTALREVQEETGITALKMKKFLGCEGYFVLAKRRVIYKRVSYYLMYCLDPAGTLKVRTNEGFIDGQWVKLPQAFLLTNPTRAHVILGHLLNELPAKEQRREFQQLREFKELKDVKALKAY